MSSRAAIYAAVVIIVMVGLLILRGMVTVVPTQAEAYLDPNHVRGMELVFEGKPYTFNFDQQLEMIDLLNRCIPVGKLRDNPNPFPGIDKIVVYLFGNKTVELTPVDLVDSQFYFRVPAWRETGYLMDISAGTLWHLLESAHDP